MTELVTVPVDVARVATAALATRAERGRGGTARGVTIATALATGVLTDHELAELRTWHDQNPDDVKGDASTLLGGLYGGRPARVWIDQQQPYEPDVEVRPEPIPVDAVVAALTARQRERFARMSTTINSVDHNLRLRLHAAAQVALAEAVRSAIAKLHGKPRNNTQRAALAAADETRRYPPSVVAAVGVTEQELLDKRFDELALAAEGWIVTAELRKLRATAQALGVDPDEERWGDEIDRRAHAAAGFLAAGLAILARQTLAGDVPVTQGEQSGPVPFSLVRSTWALGSTDTATPLQAETGPGPVPTAPLPRVDAGETIAGQLLTDHDVQFQVRSTWVTGDPVRPFEPHQDLDGLDWVDTQPDELTWDASEFPYVDALQPGDHDGCLCSIDWTYEPYEADSESLSV